MSIPELDAHWIRHLNYLLYCHLDYLLYCHLDDLLYYHLELGYCYPLCHCHCYYCYYYYFYYYFYLEFLNSNNRDEIGIVYYLTSYLPRLKYYF
jgi:hypothetical protein